jgi:cell shape-determining protein MreC
MTQEFYRIENYPDLVRDPFTGAIINKNVTEYQNYVDTYNRLKEEQTELQNLKNDVSSLKSDIGDIKTLLLTLLEGKNHDH